MATSSNMIQQTIKELTPTKVAKAMGMPTSTVFRWMTQDRIPGRGMAHKWRLDQFEAAVRKLRRSSKRARA
jgi:hypothetical protein